MPSPAGTLCGRLLLACLTSAASGGAAADWEVLVQMDRGTVLDRPHRPAPNDHGRAVHTAKKETKAGPVRVLLFLAVGSSNATMARMQRNLDSLRSHKAIEADVYMAHYDFRRSSWHEALGSEWLKEQHVVGSVEHPGFKFQLARQFLPDFLAKRLEYDFVYLPDEDVDFSRTNLTEMFLTASSTGALVQQPALAAQVTDPRVNMLRPANGDVSEEACQPGNSMCLHLAPHADCLFRYVNFVEVMTPIVRQDALLKLLTDCVNCIHEKSVWGLDNIWCSWLARQLRKPHDEGCAVLDQVTVIHDNQKTLGKYGKDGKELKDVRAGYLMDKDAVRQQYAHDFAEKPGSITCVAK